MTNTKAFSLIGMRVEELVKEKEIKNKMLEIAKENGKKEAEKWVYMVAIATLCGV